MSRPGGDEGRKEAYMPNRIEVRFQMEKATKNTVKFAEVLGSELDAPKIGALYVQKAALKELGWHEGDALAVSLSIGE